MNNRVPNIFRISSSSLGDEDRFTAFLHYVVDSVPGVGQDLVHVITTRAGLGQATFQSALDHPEGDAENRPDFLLRCVEFDILCEHKLDSDLGNSQLERYLKLPKTRSTYLALISGRNHDITDEVVGSVSYLRPQTSTALHFYWEDFYPAISLHRERLVQDFLLYMRDLGMSPSPLPHEWEDLFRSDKVAESFYELTRDMRYYFESIGGKCKADPSRRGFQIKFPTDWIHLLYISLDKVAKPLTLGIDSPFLTARIYVRKNNLEKIKFVGAQDIVTPIGKLIGRPKDEPVRWDTDLVFCYEFVGSLNNYIGQNSVDTKAKLLDFGRTVMGHIDTRK